MKWEQEFFTKISEKVYFYRSPFLHSCFYTCRHRGFLTTGPPLNCSLIAEVKKKIVNAELLGQLGLLHPGIIRQQALPSLSSSSSGPNNKLVTGSFPITTSIIKTRILLSLLRKSICLQLLNWLITLAFTFS